MSFTSCSLYYLIAYNRQALYSLTELYTPFNTSLFAQTKLRSLNLMMRYKPLCIYVVSGLICPERKDKKGRNKPHQLQQQNKYSEQADRLVPCSKLFHYCVKVLLAGDVFF